MRKDVRFKMDVLTAILLVIVTGAAVAIAALPHLLLIPGGMVVVDPAGLAVACLAIVGVMGYVLTPHLFIPMVRRTIRKR